MRSCVIESRGCCISLVAEGGPEVTPASCKAQILPSLASSTCTGCRTRRLTITIVRRIAMLLHQHSQAMQDHEDRVSPWPVSMVGPPDEPCKVCRLPNLITIWLTNPYTQSRNAQQQEGLHSESPIQGRSNASILGKPPIEGQDRTKLTNTR